MEFKLDIDIYSLVPQFFLFMKFKNSNTDVTKYDEYWKVALTNGDNPVITIKGSEEIYIHNCTRLSHGDKMFEDLIDNLGISSSYDIDPLTNTIPPASESIWYFFALPIFSYLNIPYNILTNNNSQFQLKVDLAKNRFVLPSSPGGYADLSLVDCKLIASQVFVTQNYYSNLIKNNILQYRMSELYIPIRNRIINQ